MANLPESAAWVTGIYQMETTDYATGGVNGTANSQAKQLANRTAYLKEHMDTAEADIDALQAKVAKGPSFSAITNITSNDVDPTLTASDTGKLIRLVGTANDVTLMTAVECGANNMVALVFEQAGSIICQGSDTINDAGLSGASLAATAKTMLILVSDGTSKFFVISKFVSQSGVPTGAVEAFAMSSAPAGWLKCDGTAVSRTTYAALFAVVGTAFGAGNGSTTFNLPDLRGEFIRGFDDGKGTDSGRTFGSAQADELKQHRHTINTVTVAAGSTAVAAIGTTTTGGNLTGWTGGTETRPRNIALLYCIKH